MRNNGFPSEAAVKARQEQYPPGCRVALVFLDDPYNTKLKPGDHGTVITVNSIGTVHISWDCGSCLGAAYGADQIRKL